jgi:copper homeostasis protein
MPAIVEACIDTVASAIAAERGGAARVELCASLADGGTTPSAGMVAAVRDAVPIPVFAIVRPRGGGFVYSASEIDVMRRDIEALRRMMIDGIVLGALHADGRVDVARTRALVDAAGDRPVTFHRAFDAAPDLAEALDAVVEAGAARVLTSGGARTALDGVDVIASLVARAGDRLTVIAGGGLREGHVADVVARTGVREIHVRPTRLETAPGTRRPISLRKALPVDEGAWEETDEGRVREFVRLVAAVAPPSHEEP